MALNPTVWFTITDLAAKFGISNRELGKLLDELGLRKVVNTAAGNRHVGISEQAAQLDIGRMVEKGYWPSMRWHEERLMKFLAEHKGEERIAEIKRLRKQKDDEQAAAREAYLLAKQVV